MKNNYVLNHDFGYGREEELEELNRLKLRNINDVEAYVLDIIKNGMVCSFGRRVYILEKEEIEEVQIELIKEWYEARRKIFTTIISNW